MAERNEIEEIKERLDIQTFIQTYVPSLKKSGRNYFGLCPFHNERTPSFSVNPELKLFKCFGCGEGGDVIKFIERIEGLDFPHALEYAAEKAGVKLTKKVSEFSEKHNQEKQRLLKANRLAAEYYHYVLFNHPTGEVARIYTRNRKLPKKQLKEFLIGYAPDEFNNLKSFLVKKGFKVEELVKGGLLVAKNNHVYDKFRNRLMFPIKDFQGEIIGFSGRTLGKDDFGPKYLNSPETIVFKKSRNLYGLYQAKEHIRKQGNCVMVEGNVDILSSHKTGHGNIVAPLGTALTLEQLKLIKRYTDEVLFAFDTDQAGKKALVRALDLIEEVGIQAKALDLGEYQDVDELIREGGDWTGVIEGAMPIVDFLITKLQDDYDLESARGKAEYTKTVMSYLAKLTSNIEKVHYLNKLSFIVHIDVEVLKNELPAKTEQTSIPSAGKQLSQRVENTNDEKYLLSLLVQNPELVAKAEFSFGDLGINPEMDKLLKVIVEGQEPDDEYKNLIEEAMMQNIGELKSSEHFVHEVESVANRLRQQAIRKRIKQLSMAEDSEENLKMLNDLTHELAKYK